ncbi:MAG: hypothetical protein ACI4VF_08885 [Lachnospirales bacterium]
MLRRFFIYGISGIFLEILWTGVNSFIKGDFTFTGHSSVIMFFVYGMVVFLEPLFENFIGQNLLIRVVTYSVMILMTEFFVGKILMYFGICPWVYKSRFNIDNVIRLDYFFPWMAAGFLYERLYFYLKNHITN